ncbi:MAG: DUF1003 domain-containing protein [Chitinophagales bacterium]
MTQHHHSSKTCPICQKQKPATAFVPANLVRLSVAELIQKDFPNWKEQGYICQTDLNHYRALLIEQVLQEEKGELSVLDQQVVQSIKNQELAATNLNEHFDEHITFGNRIADNIAKFGGSWRFILSFGAVLFCWILVNAYLLTKPFDPFPFILLNLVLSCLAAIQAPVIMMSQNRQETKDRLRAEQDYRINLKAELEIRALHEKLDHLLLQQWERMLEIQQMQVEMMNELTEKK